MDESVCSELRVMGGIRHVAHRKFTNAQADPSLSTTVAAALHQDGGNVAWG